MNKQTVLDVQTWLNTRSLYQLGGILGFLSRIPDQEFATTYREQVLFAMRQEFDAGRKTENQPKPLWPCEFWTHVTDETRDATLLRRDEAAE